MDYTFNRMTIEDVKEITTWRYNGHMKDIYMTPYFENYEKTGEVIGPLGCHGYVVYKDNQLIGLYEYYFKDDYIEIGLALKPEFTGKGLSKDFILEGINFAYNKYNYQKDFILLSVEKENIASYKAYLKVGFVVTDQNEEEYIMKYYK